MLHAIEPRNYQALYNQNFAAIIHSKKLKQSNFPRIPYKWFIGWNNVENPLLDKPETGGR